MYLAIFTSILAGLLCTPLAILLAHKLSFYDRPNPTNSHKQSTPLLGGLGILGGLFGGIGLFLWPGPGASAFEPHGITALSEFAIPLAVAMVSSAVIGLVDDLGTLKPPQKMLGLLPGAIIAGLLWPEPLSIGLWALFIIGFLFVTNAVNLLDTMDGLTGVMTATSALGFGLMALSVGSVGAAIAAGALAGACVAFLFFNWRFILPAAIFPGDMGSLAIGSGLFVFMAYLFQQAGTSADHVAVFLPLALVSVNALLTVYIRKRNGYRALARTKDHISERLYRAGVPRWEVTAGVGGANLIIVAAGTVAWTSESAIAEIVPIGLGIMALAALAYYSTALDLPAEDAPRYREDRICRIITRLDVGGPSQHCVYLANSLEDFGLHTILLHGNIDPDREESMEYLAEQEGVDTYRIPDLQREIRPLADLRAFWHLYLALRRMRPHIVHTHHAKAGAIGRIAAALCNVPIIVHTFHGISLRDYFGPIKNRIFLTVEQICARVSTALIATGPNDRDELVELGVAADEKFVVIPLGLPLQGLADAAENKEGQLRDELGIRDDELLVVYIGRFVPIKNVPAFIDMAANVLDQRDDVRFVLFGEGPLRNKLQQQAEDLGISDRVSFCGVTDTIERVYADADLVVLCSRREGMSLVMMESLAAAAPVVSTQVGDVTNSVIDGVTGRLVPPGDTEALSEEVLQALDNMTESRRMARAGQKHVLNSFSVEALSKRLHALYNALIHDEPYTDPVPVQLEEVGDEALKIGK